MYGNNIKNSKLPCVILIVFLLFCGSLAYGNGYKPVSISPDAKALAKSIGIDHIISAQIKQIKEDFSRRNENIFNSVVVKYPNMTEKEKIELKSILKNYTYAVIDSIDPKEASWIYAEYISKGLSHSDLVECEKFYKSKQGQKLIKTVGIAANKLNEYMLHQVMTASKTARKQMFIRLSHFAQDLKKEMKVKNRK